MADFVIHFGWIGDCFGHFIAEKAAVTLAQPMDQAFHGSLGNAESLGQA